MKGLLLFFYNAGLFLEAEAATKALTKAKASKAHGARKLKVLFHIWSVRSSIFFSSAL